MVEERKKKPKSELQNIDKALDQTNRRKIFI